MRTKPGIRLLLAMLFVLSVGPSLLAQQKSGQETPPPHDGANTNKRHMTSPPIPVPVTVVNPSVPVNGSVNVTNTAPIPVSVGNTAVPITAATPLPVSGNVNVSNTVPVQVTNTVQVQGTVDIGTPTVNLGSGTNLKLDTSSPVPVRDVDNPERRLIMLTTSYVAVGSASLSVPVPNPVNPSLVNPYIVPNGKRLVLDYVSGYVSIPAGRLPRSLELDIFGGNPPPYDVSLIPYVTNLTDSTLIHFSQPVRAYADAGSQIALFFGMDGTGSMTTSVQMTGHLIDCGTPAADDPCPVP